MINIKEDMKEITFTHNKFFWFIALVVLVLSPFAFTFASSNADSATNGADSLYGDASDNIIKGLDGNDTIKGWKGDDTLYGNKGNDTIYGGGGNDLIKGGGDDDILNGEWGNDKLLGGGGDDRLVAGPGEDKLKGGTGNDSFVFFNDDGKSNTIIDFEPGDTVVFQYTRTSTDNVRTGLSPGGTMLHYGNTKIFIKGISLIKLDTYPNWFAWEFVE